MYKWGDRRNSQWCHFFNLIIKETAHLAESRPAVTLCSAECVKQCKKYYSGIHLNLNSHTQAFKKYI